MIVGPIVAVALVIGAVAIGAALIVPLLPFALVAVVVWLLVRAGDRPAVA